MPVKQIDDWNNRNDASNRQITQYLMATATEWQKERGLLWERLRKQRQLWVRE